MGIGQPPLTYAALLALFLFVPIALVVAGRLKHPVDAALSVFFISIMFLPERTQVDLPLIPAIGKHELGKGLALVVLLTRDRARYRKAKPFRGVEALMLAFVAGAILQVGPNAQPVIWEPILKEPLVLQGLTMKDGISNLLARTINYWMPFWLGRLVVQSPDDLKRFIRVLVLAAFYYSFFSMVEQIVSPQLHKWIYGYHQHEFLQTLRMGGYRPMIFMYHGLVVAQFMLLGASAAVIMARTKQKALKYTPKAVAIYQVVQLVLMKSTGAIIFGMASLSVLALANARAQLRVALIFVVIILAYPFSKIQGVFPSEGILDVTTAIVGLERADSLGDRFRNDIILVDRAKERLMFGWGGYLRSELFNKWGKQESVPDATWVILLGHMGLFGLVPFFACLCWPVVALRRTFERIKDPHDRLMCSGLAIMVITYGFDLMLNSMNNGLPMLLPGALLGAVGYFKTSAARSPARQAAPMGRPLTA